MAIAANEVFEKSMTQQDRAAASRRGAELVAEYATLQQVRKARLLTQTQLGELWGKDQVSISQIEKRSDMLLSTLRSYIEAMGGQLNLVVQFKDQPPVHLAGFTGNETVQRPFTPPAAPR